MLSDTTGLHHVTGIVGAPGPSVAFYAGTLGLRLLRTTVNYEDVLSHHLYFGVGDGEPGSVLTVFPDPTSDPGRVGRPGFESVAFAVPPGSLGYWRDRLSDRLSDDVSGEVHGDVSDDVPDAVPDGRGTSTPSADAAVTGIGEETRFGDSGIRVHDPAGTTVELIASADPREPWAGGSVPPSAAIRGLYGVTALPTDPYGAASVLETLGFAYEGETDDRVRYRAPGDHATVVDLLDRDAPYVREGPGTLHHAAARVPDRAALLAWHDLFRERGYHVSRVKDRHFFHSLYVRGPGGLLVELATEKPTPDGPPGPGLADPAVAGHATELYLPDRLAADRAMITDQLPAITAPASDPASASDSVSASDPASDPDTESRDDR